MECGDTYDHLCAYLDGELDVEMLGAVEEHLRTCPSCTRELELQQSVKSLIQKQFLNVTAPGSLREKVMFELGRAEEYRESGIPALDLIRWGTHIAQLYTERSEMAEVLAPYMEKGLEQNELCVWVTSDISEEEAREVLAARVPRLQECIDSGQVQTFSDEDWYLPRGSFNAQGVLNSAVEKCQEAISGGYSGFRITGNLLWLEQSDWNSFMEYEHLLDAAIPNYKALAICTYKESKCTPDNIADVMSTHKHVLSKMDGSWSLRREAEIA